MTVAPPTGVLMTVETDGSLLCTLTHGPSGVHVLTDAPRDNGGQGSAFSPTDLTAVSLASCMLTTMALAATRERIAWGPASARVEKRMTPPPRRIGELVMALTMPRELPAEQRAHFEDVARGCPVSRSLHPETRVTLSFEYPV